MTAVHLRIGVRTTSCDPDGPPAPPAQLTGDWKLVTCEQCKATPRYRKAIADEEERKRLPLIGHDVVLIRNLAYQLLRGGTAGHLATGLSVHGMDGRGFRFDVAIAEPDGKPSGRIARVQVTLDRVVQPADIKVEG